MSRLGQATGGKVDRPPFISVYGPEGVGKTNFAAGAPGVIFHEPENGSFNYDVKRFPTPPETFEMAMDDVRELINEAHSYKTYVLDSADWLEKIIHKRILLRYPGKSMVTAAGGYQKAYDEAAELFKDYLDLVDYLRFSRQMNIILIAHARASDFEDPINQCNYKVYKLKVHKHIESLIKEKCDAVLFTNFDTQVTFKNDNPNEKARASSLNQRLIYVEKNAGFDAKNRYDLVQPFVHDKNKGWATFAQLISGREVDPPHVIIGRIKELREKCGNPVVQAKIDGYLGGPQKTDKAFLLELEEKIKTLLKG